MGAKSRDAPANLKPVGTGPYKFVDFKPGDMVSGEINPNYHEANRPHFDTIEMKGGGDAVSAARAVIQTGEFDYAWNMQVEDEILQRLEKGGKGTRRDHARRQHRAHPAQHHRSLDRGRRRALEPQDQAPAALRSRPCARRSACWSTASRSRSTSTAAPASPPATSSTTPSAFRSKNTKWEFNVDKANQLLEAAGWKKGPDGIRAKDGKKLKFVYQTSINAPRQKTQAIVKQACQKAGIDMELKSVTASVFFSSDVANPDTYTKFYCDIQMYTTTMTQPDPELFMNQFTSWEVATKENKWQGRNITRWQQRGVRQGLPRRRGRARSGQARGAVHPHERPGVRATRRSSRSSTGRAWPRISSKLRAPHQRLGQRPLEAEGLVPGGMSLQCVARGDRDRDGR